MQRTVTFEELPKDLRDRITGLNEVNISCGDQGIKVLKCNLDEDLGDSRCFIKFCDGVVAIYEMKSVCEKINRIFLNSSDLKFLLDAMKEEEE
ncbi:hypothetical protein REC12_11885 [Desulfosporosinus sp. PR]|uniref:hypothetical protein n=1 Tax=Candidatus Desulfosporosinus nitrosoreducens TaxID=3401928 RepID=UPI0027FB7321|nr:hypothetical protein [Desulfosporosinus sp. PR]MDQ7094290.1 hypothetical protein [Desulfosporosinus sp. PR]